MRDQAVKFASIKAKRFNLKTGFVSVFRYIHNSRVVIKNLIKRMPGGFYLSLITGAFRKNKQPYRKRFLIS
jgi:hypothetical protein